MNNAKQEGQLNREPEGSPGAQAERFKSFGRTAFWVLLSGACYYLATQIAWALCFPDTKVSLFFPPHAVLVSVLLLVPTRHWWAYTLVAIGGHFLATQQAHWPFLYSLHCEAFDAVQNVATAAGLRLFIKSPLKLITLRDAIVFVLIAVVIVPFGTAFWGAAFTVSNHFGTRYWVEWRNLGISNAVTAVVLVPAILLGITRLSAPRIKVAPTRLIEAGFLGASILTAGIFAFDLLLAGPSASPALLYAQIPLLIWAGLRFGLGGVSASMLIITFQAIWGTMHGRGPFLMQTPAENALALQTFLLVSAIPLMLLSVVIEVGKRSQDRLRESEERMTLAAKATGVGVWVWNIPGNEVWGSERWLVLFGFAPDTTVTFEKVIQRIHLDDRKMVEDEVRRVLADRGEYMADFRVVLPDSTERWIVARGRIYQDSHGKPARMMGTAFDITYRKRTELELAESELRYRTLFETVPEGIALIGVDGYVRAVNPAQARLYGYESPQQLEGLYAPLCVAEKDRERATQVMKDLLNGEEQLTRHYTAMRCDGSEFIVEVTSAILRGLGREIQGYLCLTRDITERQRTEQELQRHRTELAHVSRVSTMGALTASLAHELNQPLSAILSNAQAGLRFLTAAAPDIGEVHGALEDIAQDTKRAGEVIRQMRALVRKDDPKLQPLDVNRVISEVVRLLHSDMVIRKIRITLEPDADLRPVSGDSVQLQQVVLNLVGNAFDAMRDIPEDRRIMTVRTRQQDPSLVRVEVSDHGTGISAEKLLTLFEPFRSSKREGLGLGLSISHSIIEAHKGRLWAENNPAGGATFYFTLPVHETELNLG